MNEYYLISDLIELVIPLSICVVLPIVIVWITSHYRSKQQSKKIDLLTKAIESGREFDTEALMNAVVEQPKPRRERNPKGMLVAFLSVGVGLIAMAITLLTCALVPNGPSDIMTLFLTVMIALGSAFIAAFFFGRRMLLEKDGDSRQ